MYITIDNMPNIAVNKTLKRDYQVMDTLEAGIKLTGAEVKSVKLGQIQLKGSYISIDRNNQIWLINCHISYYKPSGPRNANYNPTRSRVLLMHRKEIDSLVGKIHQPGLTILPLSVYTKGNLIKLEIAIVRGKKKFDKREEMKNREIEKEIRRNIRGKY